MFHFFFKFYNNDNSPSKKYRLYSNRDYCNLSSAQGKFTHSVPTMSFPASKCGSLPICFCLSIHIYKEFRKTVIFFYRWSGPLFQPKTLFHAESTKGLQRDGKAT